MSAPILRDLLLAPRLEPGAVVSLLAPFGFRDISKADANLQRIADEPRAREILAEMVEELLTCLGDSADPDQALNSFERYSRVVHKVELLSHLRNAPRVLDLLARAMGASPFIAEILIRHPEYLHWVADPAVLQSLRSTRVLLADLTQALSSLKSHERRLDMLRVFKRKELLQIGVRDLLRLATVEDTLEALSGLAEALIQKACDISFEALLAECGDPAMTRTPSPQEGFTVIGMGKLGGGELNFSSDVDLMYLYADEDSLGELQRALKVPLPDFFSRLSKRLTAALSEATNEGFVYRVDLRLRPEGRVGPVAASLSEFDRYYASRAATWERLALLKAWPVAGDLELGRRLLERVEPFVYGRPFDPGALASLREIKSRMDGKIAGRGETRTHVKLGLGGIREIELIVQSIQVARGQRLPGIRDRNTLRSLEKLEGHGLLPAAEAASLAAAYRFLRDVENKLQMVFDTQVHSLPTEREALGTCALRLGYGDRSRGGAAEVFRGDYDRHTAEVHRIFQSFFGEPSRLLG